MSDPVAKHDFENALDALVESTAGVNAFDMAQALYRKAVQVAGAVVDNTPPSPEVKPDAVSDTAEPQVTKKSSTKIIHTGKVGTGA